MAEGSKALDSKSSRRLQGRLASSNLALSAKSRLYAERWLSGRRRSPGERVGG